MPRHHWYRFLFLLIVVVLLLCAVRSVGQTQAEPAQAATVSVEDLVAQGDALRLHHDYSGALACFRAASRRAPKDARLWNRMGMVELQLNQLGDAESDFDHAIKLDRKYAQAYNNLGVTFYLGKNYKKAIRQYERALKLDETVASFHNNLAAAYFSRNEMDKAGQEYTRALQLDPEIFRSAGGVSETAQMRSPEERAQYNYMVAQLYARSGKVDDALEFLRKAVEEGYKDTSKIQRDAAFASLREDPRFAQIVKHPQADLMK